MLDLVFLICHDYCLFMTFNWSFTRCPIVAPYSQEITRGKKTQKAQSQEAKKTQVTKATKQKAKKNKNTKGTKSHNSRKSQEARVDTKKRTPKKSSITKWNRGGIQFSIETRRKWTTASLCFVFNGRISRYDRITHLPSRMSKTYREWESPGHATNEQKFLPTLQTTLQRGSIFLWLTSRNLQARISLLQVDSWTAWQLSIFSGVAFGAD